MSLSVTAESEEGTYYSTADAKLWEARCLCAQPIPRGRWLDRQQLTSPSISMRRLDQGADS